MRCSAIIAPDGRYRYRLDRAWDDDLPTIAFIMLNPSTADGETDDNTIRKCVKFAQRWGYGRLLVGNLFAYRATDPADLFAAYTPGPDGDIIGPENNEHLYAILRASEDVVCAWGAKNPIPRRAAYVRDMIAGERITPHVLALTKDGSPRHPLYMRDDTLRVPYV